jgi:hypothetical protein
MGDGLYDDDKCHRPQRVQITKDQNIKRQENTWPNSSFRPKNLFYLFFNSLIWEKKIKLQENNKGKRKLLFRHNPTTKKEGQT